MALKRIALLLTVLGGINWGLVGAFKFDLLRFALGFLPGAVVVAQIIIGLAAAYVLFAYMIK
ncbi:MAG: DUF378 domain-containing protein [Alphaproteobacteria bacterium]|nr:DUF378 domain-containing protein [Alphaproteobacteria bacterium]